MERATETELRAARAISILAAVAYPLFWWLHRLGDQVWLDPLSIRLVVSAYALSFLALSYRSSFVHRSVHRFLIGLIYLITLHFFVLLVMNRLHWEFVLGVLLVLTAMNAGSSLGFRDRRSLNAYLATILAATVTTVVLVEDPVVPIPYFLAAMATGIVVSYFGIGAQLESRGQLLENRRQLQTVLRGAPIVFWATDRDGRVAVAEGKGLETLDMEIGRVRGRPITDLFVDDLGFRSAFGKALDGEASHATATGAGAVFETWQAPLRDADGSVVGTVGVATDVTALHSMSRKLRQAQKMEAVGQLAGGIAHDFNNILTAVVGYAQFARGEVADGGVVADSLDEIRKASDRAAALVQQLLAFSRQQSLEPRRIDLNELVRSMLSMLRPLLGEDLVLVSDLSDEVPEIEVDPTGIEQILMNLAVNARDACPSGGTVTIAIRRALVAADSPGAPRSLAPGRYALLEFADDGRGMDSATLERAFEPFFTTKPFGAGSGLGLSTVYGIVEQTKGAIEVESEPGWGTTFRVWLPGVADEAVPARLEVVSHPSRRDRSRTSSAPQIPKR